MEEKADMSDIVSDFLTWIDERLGYTKDYNAAFDVIMKPEDQTNLKLVWDSLPEKERLDTRLISIRDVRMKNLPENKIDEADPAEKFISSSLNQWLDTIKKYQDAKPEEAKENLIKLSADVMKIAATSAVIDLGLGMLPNSAGTASATNTKQLLAWLGVGAVVTAVAHDPVKIGLLRPYQDSLESTFRNKRPDHISVMQSYTQRSLSPTRIDDPDKITDELMTKVENENDKKFDEEMARHGYNQWFIDVLKDTSTKTLTFSNLAQLAKMGHYNRGLATYSLWGMGLDRRLMKAALDTLDRMNEVSQFEGFRSMIEPSYVEGDISEAELTEYYNNIRVPLKVQTWILPRMRKRRDAYALKQKTGAAVKERDLTVSQVQQAYQNLLLDRAKAQNMILELGYQLEEVKILLDLAEMRRKLPTSTSLKRLPLTDYEKAYKNKLITQDEVLGRMKGEYTAGDIELERKLLEIGKA
jgi:hypothetical protein